jgi:hypothetical protein
MTSPLSFNHSAKHAIPRTFPQANLCKMAIRAVLWPLGLCVMYYRNHCTLQYISLMSENKRKRGVEGSGLESKVSLVKAVCAAAGVLKKLSHASLAKLSRLRYS